jgi:hypothetical protein
MESFEETFSLFKKGLSMPEIAYKRKLAFSTIENHLQILLEKKRITIEELLPPERVQLIRDALPEKFERLTEIKEKLPKDVSFGEIRWVLTSLGKFAEKKKQAPIVTAIHTWIGNNCSRKCFNHPEIFDECREKFESLSQGAANENISVSDFYKLMNSGGINICKLPPTERRKVIIWKIFEQMQDNGKDSWDSIGNNKETTP